MDKFKVDNFESGNKSVLFPGFTSLGSGECDLIRMRLCERLALPTSSGGVVLVSRLHDIQTSVIAVNAGECEFNIQSTVLSAGITPDVFVLINWYRFDEIDRMAMSDFSEYFKDIWHPDSDDIDVFDSSLSWVLSVAHSGSVNIASLQSK